MVTADSDPSALEEPHERESQGDKRHSTISVTAALIGNFLIACAKTFAYFYSGGLGAAPFGMLAEALHSWGDTSSQGSLLRGIFQARKKADSIFPFGYGKAQFVWSGRSASIAIALGGAAVGQAIYGFTSETAPHVSLVSIIVFILAGVIESITFGIAVRGLWKSKNGLPLRRYLKETSDPAEMAVLLEDSIAVTGILTVLGGIGLTKLTGNPIYDAIASLIVGVLMIGMGAILAKMTDALLMGRSNPVTERKITEILINNKYVQSIHLLQTMFIGVEQVFARVEVELKEEEVMKRLNGGTKRRITEVSNSEDLEKVMGIIMSVKNEIELEIRRIPEVVDVALKERRLEEPYAIS